MTTATKPKQGTLPGVVKNSALGRLAERWFKANDAENEAFHEANRALLPVESLGPIEKYR